MAVAGRRVRMIRAILPFLAVAACALLHQTAEAESAESVVQQRGAEVVMGVTMGVFFHELAHAMIGELALAATGPEEDVADEFSALMMGQLTQDVSDPGRINVATYSSLLWHRLALENQRSGQSAPWYGEHAPDMRRFRHTFCRLYGSNPAVYNELADRFQLDRGFRLRCVEEYRKRYKAWESIGKDVSRDLGPDSPGVFAADTPGGRIDLVVGPSNTGYEPMVRMMFAEGLTEMLDEFSRRLVWPRDILVEFRDCGRTDAYYDPATGGITMCYEMIEHLTRIVLQAEGIAVAPQQGGAAGSFMHGVWWARLSTVYGPLDVTITYSPNQTYQSDEVWVQTGVVAARVVGTWATEAAGDQFLVHRLPEQWLPQQVCYYSQAACQRGRQTTSHAAFVDQNAMHVDGLVWQRIQ